MISKGLSYLPGISNQSTVQVVPTSESTMAAEDKERPNDTWRIAAGVPGIMVGLERYTVSTLFEVHSRIEPHSKQFLIQSQSRTHF